MAPALSHGKEIFGGHVPFCVAFGGGLNAVGEENAAPVAVEFEFLDALGQAAKVLEKFFLIVASQSQVVLSTIDEHAIAKCADDAEDAHDQKDLPGEPAEIGRAAHEN